MPPVRVVGAAKLKPALTALDHLGVVLEWGFGVAEA